ncbi:MAG: EpsG family protein [Paludibacteraceae bacterium]|nr:EpsG family protein [Paludibacteraceae bacterium]
MFDLHESHFYQICYYGTLLPIGLLLAWLYFSCPNRNIRNGNSVITYLLFIFIVILLTYSPSIDKTHYLDHYRELLKYEIGDYRDIAWLYLSYGIAYVTKTSEIAYFFIVAMLTMSFTFFFCKKCTKEVFTLFLVVIISFGFRNYAINILRGGLALSILLCAYYCFYQNKLQSVLLVVLSLLFHKSIAIPVSAFLLTYYFSKTIKYNYLIWLCCLGVSWVIGDSLNEIVADIFMDADDRVEEYLLAEETGYKVGFRMDFIAYSLIPMAFGYYHVVVRDYKDEFYVNMLNTYLIANAIWLIVIRMPFTDRVAYLSWFLSPYLILLPFLKSNENGCNNQKIAAVILFVVFVAYVLSLSKAL